MGIRAYFMCAFIATTSLSLHCDDVKRARQMSTVFSAPTR